MPACFLSRHSFFFQPQIKPMKKNYKKIFAGSAFLFAGMMNLFGRGLRLGAHMLRAGGARAGQLVGAVAHVGALFRRQLVFFHGIRGIGGNCAERKG